MSDRFERPEPEPKKSFVETGIELLEAMTPMVETLDGFKALLADHGFSENAQEEMAVELFRSIMRGQQT